MNNRLDNDPEGSNSSNTLVVNLVNIIGKKSFIQLKRHFNEIVVCIIVRTEKIGGPNKVVELDETVITRRGLIRFTSQQDDNTEITDLTWLFGGIERGNITRYFLVVVENSQSCTLKTIIERHIETGTEIITDGHPSYPNAIDSERYSHEIVNNNVGFVNSESEHANTIGTLWSHLKNEIRKRHGVLRANILEFLIEFENKKKFKTDTERTHLYSLFIRMLKIGLEKNPF